jgi:hypothetical protein
MFNSRKGQNPLRNQRKIAVLHLFLTRIKPFLVILFLAGKLHVYNCTFVLMYTINPFIHGHSYLRHFAAKGYM